METNYFQLPVLMLMLITLLNDGTLITIAYDRVTPSPRPEKWNLPVLFVTSGVLAAVACGSSLLLLWGALDSNNPDGWFASWGLPGLQYGQVWCWGAVGVECEQFDNEQYDECVQLGTVRALVPALCAVGWFCSLSHISIHHFVVFHTFRYTNCIAMYVHIYPSAHGQPTPPGGDDDLPQGLCF